MIDTIKLCHKISLNEWSKISKHFPNSSISNNGISRSTINPTNLDRKNGTYKPKITLTKRPSSHLMEILVEFSAPKLLFGNNFDEFSERDFPSLREKIGEIFESIGITLSDSQISNLEVRKVDFCKNIPLSKHIFPSIIINHIAKGNFPLNKDIQKTDFRNGGQILHIHTNSVDIALYDKISDLKQSTISEKRSLEKDYYCQKNLAGVLSTLPQILRFEVRINTSRQLKTELRKETMVKLSDIIATEQAKLILSRHWNQIMKYAPKSQIDKNTPLSNLSNIPDKNLKPTTALAYVGVQSILADNCDLRAFRHLFEKTYGKHSWRRIKPLLEPISGKHLTELITIERTISDDKPLRIKDFTFVK